MDDLEPEGIDRKRAAQPYPNRSDSRKGSDKIESATNCWSLGGQYG
jgi:hypothetical protein